MKMPSNRCKGHNRSGGPCGKWAMVGQLVCRSHGGAAPQNRAAATRRMALAEINQDIHSFGLGGTDVDPGETLLRLLSQARARAAIYSGQIAALVDEHGLMEALVGDSLMVNPSFTGGSRANGQPKFVKIGEYKRALTQLEYEERDRAARYAKLAIDADLITSQTKNIQAQGALIELILTTAFEHLRLTPEQRKEAPAAIRAALESVA